MGLEDRFGRLLFLREAEDKYSPSGQKYKMWLCLCDCGNEVEVRKTHVKSGATKSCGCLNVELIKQRSETHRMTNTRVYEIWAGMKKRCDNRYDENYGGRGISYQASWIHFENFWEDMSEGYSDGLTLDRIDSEGNYCKENCRWATVTSQSRNRLKSKNNTSGHAGVTKRVCYGYVYWVALWNSLDGKQKSKGFSVLKYGEEIAFDMACRYRTEMIDNLNEQGAGYSDKHGKDRKEKVQ